MLTEKIKLTLKDAAKKLTGSKKRAFMAQATIDYWNSSPRKAETELGWSRKAIATGLKEKVSARKVREALISEKGYSGEGLPCRQTIGEILNRMGYRLKKPKR